jgi:hypothetical protein
VFGLGAAALIGGPAFKRLDQSGNHAPPYAQCRTR